MKTCVVRYWPLGESIPPGWAFRRHQGPYHGCFSVLLIWIGGGETRRDGISAVAGLGGRRPMEPSPFGASTLTPMAARIKHLVECTRLDLSNEKEVQLQLSDLMAGAGIAFDREKPLGPGDVPDFIVGDLVLEVKMRGAAGRLVARQLVRYAAHGSVAALMLITNRSVALPALIEGKPLYIASLSKAWL